MRLFHKRNSLTTQSDGPPTDTGTSYDSAYTYARPSSYHPDLVLATFCDGHVKRLRESIKYYVYAALMTPDGQGSMNAGSNSPPAGQPATWAPTGFAVPIPTADNPFAR